MLQNLVFFALAPRSGFGAAISHTVVRSSVRFYRVLQLSLWRSAASSLLGAAAACVILLSFAAGHSRSYSRLHQGCDSELCAKFLLIS